MLHKCPCSQKNSWPVASGKMKSSICQNVSSSTRTRLQDSLLPRTLFKRAQHWPSRGGSLSQNLWLKNKKLETNSQEKLATVLPHRRGSNRLCRMPQVLCQWLGAWLRGIAPAQTHSSHLCSSLMHQQNSVNQIRDYGKTATRDYA